MTMYKINFENTVYIASSKKETFTRQTKKKRDDNLGLIHAVCSPPFYYVNSSENEN